MKRSYWLIAFGIVLAGELAGIQTRNETLQFIFKPLIIPSVLGYYLAGTVKIPITFKKWIIPALFFSWIGDLLLLFDGRGEIYFLLGLSAFLVAHLFYILFFHQVRVREAIRSHAWLLLIVAVYYLALITLLSPYLGDKKLPVRIYGIVISFMFLLAMHMLYIRQKTAGMRMMIGALLFVISDSLLAINKFYQSFEGAGLLVIVTYALAQLLIADGASRYARSVQSH